MCPKRTIVELYALSKRYWNFVDIMSDIRSTSTVRPHTNFCVCIMHNSELCTFRPFVLNWYYRNQTLLLLVRRNNYWLLQINNIFENVYVILVFAMNCLEFLILGLSQVYWRIEYVNVNSTLLLIFPVQWFSTDYVFQLWQSRVTPGNLVNKSPGEFYFNK